MRLYNILLEYLMFNNRPFVYYLDIYSINRYAEAAFRQASNDIFKNEISHGTFQISPGIEGYKPMNETGSERRRHHHPHIGLRGLRGILWTFEKPIKAGSRLELSDEARHDFLLAFQ
ncbi:MAG: hypothetical protein ACYC6G_17515 [Desulfobaccales bacterium]